ncbi:metallophosphoesterase family protein [Falsiroseomonas sp. HW251]|uniref:metallophosphoesterase family protein n=1 Tax=Falsiroseomonas sp. HW251 TaxID=3390998 RepID=UPI003D3228DF
MTRIAHLTDLHFGAEDLAVVAALVEDVAAAAPDLVAVSGDLTQRARHGEFHAAVQFLRALGAPVLAVPGNHDVTPFDLFERFADPWHRWRRHVGKETEPVWMDDEVAVIGLNTARRGGLYLNWARGVVGRARLARLEARLAAIPPHLFRIVVAHHPFAAPALNPAARLVGGAAPALAAFARHDVRMVLSGHLHLPDVAPVAGARMMLVQGATATSHRLRGAPNAWHLVTVEQAEARVISRRWDGVRWISA